MLMGKAVRQEDVPAIIERLARHYLTVRRAGRELHRGGRASGRRGVQGERSMSRSLSRHELGDRTRRARRRPRPGEAPQRPAPTPAKPANDGHGDVRKKIVPIVRPPAGPSATAWEGGVYLSMQQWLDGAEQGGAILLQPGDDVRALSGRIDHAALIAVDFHRIGDGRGYTHAFLLRNRLSYAGRLRALGAVTADQVFALARVGFDSFALRADQDAKAALAALDTFAVPYQGAAVAGAAQERAAANANASIRLLERALTAIADRHQRPALGLEPVGRGHGDHGRDRAPELPIDVFTLDTGRLHAETLALIEETRQRYGLEIDVRRPDEAAVAAYVAAYGRDGFYEGVAQRKLCCNIRKVVPLNQALQGRDAWITGQRRDQAVTRGALAESERDSERSMQKYNPLADWSWSDVLAYAGALRHSDECALRARLRFDRLRTLHQGHSPGGGPAGGALVVGKPGQQRMRFAYDSGAMMNGELGEAAPAPTATTDRLDRLEAEAVYILRDLAPYARPALMFSGGKDFGGAAAPGAEGVRAGEATVCAVAHRYGPQLPRDHRLSRRARARDRPRSRRARASRTSIRRGSVRLASETASRNAAQAVTLIEAQHEFSFDALIGGARRDEERPGPRSGCSRIATRSAPGARERSGRNSGAFTTATSPPARTCACFRCRIGPRRTSGPTSRANASTLPALYYAHTRDIVRRDGFLVPVSALTPAGPEEAVERLVVRFRTVGDISCTCPVESRASTPEQVLRETLSVSVSERGATRMDDRVNSAAMERRKLEGYF